MSYTKHSCLAASWYSISSFLYISTDWVEQDEEELHDEKYLYYSKDRIFMVHGSVK